MLKNRIIIYLLPDEREALSKMSKEDVRPPDAQIRFLLQQELARRGMLSTHSANNNTVAPIDQIERDRVVV